MLNTLLNCYWEQICALIETSRQVLRDIIAEKSDITLKQADELINFGNSTKAKEKEDTEEENDYSLREEIFAAKMKQTEVEGFSLFNVQVESFNLAYCNGYCCSHSSHRLTSTLQMLQSQTNTSVLSSCS